MLQTTKYDLKSKPGQAVEVLAKQTINCGKPFGEIDIDGPQAADGLITKLDECRAELTAGRYNPVDNYHMGQLEADYINTDDPKEQLRLQDVIALTMYHDQVAFVIAKQDPDKLEGWDEQARKIACDIQGIMGLLDVSVYLKVAQNNDYTAPLTHNIDNDSLPAAVKSAALKAGLIETPSTQ